MNKALKNCVGMVAGVALLGISACAPGAGPGLGLGEESSTPEVAAFLDHDVEYALTETIVEGALIGAVVAGGACALLGGNFGQCAAAAGGGAVVGGVAGVAVAEGNRQQEVYKAEQNALAEQLAAEREGLRVRGTKLEQAIASLRAKERSLRRDYQQGLITQEQLSAQAAAMRRDAERIDEKNNEELAELDKREEDAADVEMNADNRSVFNSNASTLLRHDRLGEEVLLDMDDFANQPVTS